MQDLHEYTLLLLNNWTVWVIEFIEYGFREWFESPTYHNVEISHED